MKLKTIIHKSTHHKIQPQSFMLCENHKLDIEHSCIYKNNNKNSRSVKVSLSFIPFTIYETTGAELTHTPMHSVMHDISPASLFEPIMLPWK
jgi:hypothetical protein